MLSNDVLVVIQPYIFQKICPINKNSNILQNIHTKAQTNDTNPYRNVLLYILSNDRLKTIIRNNCSKGYIDDKLEKTICCCCTYYPNVVQSMTIRTCDKNYSTFLPSKSINRHMKERELNKDSGTIIYLNIPIIGEFLYGYN